MSVGGGSYINLFCGHPPFQIDGNFGGTAGIAEMLLQSQDGYIEFLPALPDDWKDGSFSGWRARGGAELSASWHNSKLDKVHIKAMVTNTFKIKVPGNISSISIYKSGKHIAADPAGHFLFIHLKKGELAEIIFM